MDCQNLKAFAENSHKKWIAHWWKTNKKLLAVAAILACAYARTHLFHQKNSWLAEAVPFWEISISLFIIILIVSFVTVFLERHFVTRYCTTKEGDLVSYHAFKGAKYRYIMCRIGNAVTETGAFVIGGVVMGEIAAPIVILIVTLILTNA